MWINTKETNSNQSALSLIIKKSLLIYDINIKEYLSYRCMTLEIKFNNQYTLLIVNVYITPKNGKYKEEQIEFIKTNIILPNKNNDKKIIILGDYNEYNNGSIDRWSNYQIQNTNKNFDFIKMLKKYDFTDSFRYINDDERKFTRIGIYNINNNIKYVKTRIDHIYINNNVLEKIKNCQIIEEELLNSDHRLIFIELDN